MSPPTDSGRWSRPEAALAGTGGPEGRGLLLRRLRPDRVGPGRSAEKGMSRRFLADTRGAVGIVAALLTTMVVGGMALVIDHLWLAGKRDMLKDATDAATLAATLELSKLPAGMSDTDVETALQPVARRYVLLNLLDNLPSEEARTAASNSLVVSVHVHRAAGLVDVTAEAELGETLLSKLLFDAEPAGKMKEESRVEATMIATEVVLAIDVTKSMNKNLQGQNTTVEDDRRLEIVRLAGINLVNILETQAGGMTPLAMGIVPWSYRVRLDPATRKRWEDEGWAVYPGEQLYPYPPAGKGPASYDHPERQTLPFRDEIANECRAWRGCLNPRATTSDGAGVPPAFSTALLPRDEPFTMSFFTAWTGENTSKWYGNANHLPQYLSYGCQQYDKVAGWEEPVCYDLDRAESPDPSTPAHCQAHPVGSTSVMRQPPQFDCDADEPEVLPLTADLDAARNRLTGLAAPKWSTYSAIGVAWGARLLDPAWRDAWGDPVHPMASTAARPVQKVLVLLTDGQDSHQFDDAHRAIACDEAKAAGVRVFVVAAMVPRKLGTGFSDALVACSSQSDDPDGTYVFLNNGTPDNLKAAFQEIGRQLLVMRRVH